MSDQIRVLLDLASHGCFRDLAKLLTALEREAGAAAFECPLFLEPPQTALRIGVTGPPGAGKSTIVNHLISEWRQRGSQVGVLAVDPSSPFSGGAILGDRIRYSPHFTDSQVFIRSLGTRGSLGGLSSAAYLMVRALDLWNFDVVLIETVGVGQTEWDILNVADVVVLVLVPESGDSIQVMKAGLMEVADVFVINKADRPGAEALVKELQFYLMDGVQDKHKETDKEQNKNREHGQSFSRKLFQTVATQKIGIKEMADDLWSLGQKLPLSEHRGDPQRLQNEALALLRGQWEMHARERIKKITTPQELAEVVIKEMFL